MPFAGSIFFPDLSSQQLLFEQTSGFFKNASVPRDVNYSFSTNSQDDSLLFYFEFWLPLLLKVFSLTAFASRFSFIRESFFYGPFMLPRLYAALNLPNPYNDTALEQRLFPRTFVGVFNTLCFLIGARPGF